MTQTLRKLAALTVIGVAFASAAQAVTLAPGAVANLRDANGNLLDTGFSAVADSSLNGTIIASASRSLTMDTTYRSSNPLLPATHQSLTAIIDDWVVRRADTATIWVVPPHRQAQPQFGSVDPWTARRSAPTSAGRTRQISIPS